MCQETSHQESKCCSTSPSLEKEKQLTEKRVLLVEEERPMTSHCPSVKGMGYYSGFATGIRAGSKDDQKVEVAAEPTPKSQTPEVQSEGGLLGRLRRYLKSKPLTYIPGMQSPHRLQQEQDSAGTQRRIGSQCQCEMYKGRSLG